MSPNVAASELSAPTATPALRPAKVLPGVALDQYSGDPNFMASLTRGLRVGG